jgi:hypothetical protein
MSKPPKGSLPLYDVKSDASMTPIMMMGNCKPCLPYCFSPHFIVTASPWRSCNILVAWKNMEKGRCGPPVH